MAPNTNKLQTVICNTEESGYRHYKNVMAQMQTKRIKMQCFIIHTYGPSQELGHINIKVSVQVHTHNIA